VDFRRENEKFKIRLKWVARSAIEVSKLSKTTMKPAQQRRTSAIKRNKKKQKEEAKNERK
jgi:hypothetical protein